MQGGGMEITMKKCIGLSALILVFALMAGTFSACKKAEKAAKEGCSLQDVITQALAAAKAGVDATKDMVPVFGKAAVHAAQCVGVEDQGAVAGYYKILGLSKYICE